MHAGGILVPRPWIEPVPSAVEVLSLNHWTVREVPPSSLKKKIPAVSYLHPLHAISSDSCVLLSMLGELLFSLQNPVHK